MTAIVSSPARSWFGAHRAFLIVLAFAIALAATATIAIAGLTSASTGSSTTPSSWPVAPEELSDYEKCVMARVRVC